MKEETFRNDVLPLKNKIYRLALRVTLNPVEAEDIVQDTLLRLWDKRDMLGEVENLEAFAYTVCRNLALDRMKRLDNKNESLDASVMERADAGTSPSEQTIQSDRVELVRKIMNTLPEKQRSCIQLRDFEGKPYKEIAEVLNITEEQVKVNIFRGRQFIKKRFNEIDNYGL